MILGTVQLGLHYGINNSFGKPNLIQVFKMLDYAYENGIKILDTGPMYGNAEEIIGKYIGKNGKRFTICTKLPDILPEENKISDDVVSTLIQKSLERLNINHIYCYYLHQFYQCKYKKLMDALISAKNKGLIDYIGISVYDPSELIYICNNLNNVVDVVQIPYNIFSAFLWNEALEQAKKANIKIFARSIFLQGLAFSSPESKFSVKIGAGEYNSYVQHLAAAKNQKVEQICFDAVIDHEVIEDVICGAEALEQLMSNIELEKNHLPLNENELADIAYVMSDISKDIINPTKWEKYK